MTANNSERMLSDRRIAQIKIYGLFVVIGLLMIIGMTNILAGVVLIILMAITHSVNGVVAASFMAATGVALVVGPYLYLTT